MKALTVCQPYAHYLADGTKPCENRTWPTTHRGMLAIHAGKSLDWLLLGGKDPLNMAFGAVVAVVDLYACVPLRDVPEALLKTHREHVNGPWCWLVKDVRRLREPVPCQGRQGLWTLPVELDAEILRQVRR